MNDREPILNEVKAIAATLAGSAFRSRGRATWLTNHLPDDPRSTPKHPTLRALGAPLYDGAAGVGLFLGEASALAKEPEWGELAVDAISYATNVSREALEKDPRPQAARLGVYTGPLGVAWAAIHIGRKLGSERLLEEGHGLVETILDDGAEGPLFQDVMSGSAGAIPVLLHLDELGTKGARDLARACAEKLSEEAIPQGEALAWVDPLNPPWHRPLTGFSHGSTGIAWSLAIAHVAFGDARYLESAEGGFAYDRQVFDAEEGNWPDMRNAPSMDGAYRFMRMWCHGAPGIAMARAHASVMLRDATLREEAEIGIETTRRAVEEMDLDGGWNFQLCHGLGGNAETLALTEAILDVPDAGATTRRVLRAAVARYGKSAREDWESRFVDWPTGLAGAREVSLMRGYAGIGHALLRAVAREDVAPVLLPALPRALQPSWATPALLVH